MWAFSFQAVSESREFAETSAGLGVEQLGRLFWRGCGAVRINLEE
jgi:hypothetical protein